MTNIDSDEDVYSTCTEDYKNFRNLEAMPNTRNLLVC